MWLLFSFNKLELLTSFDKQVCNKAYSELSRSLLRYVLQRTLSLTPAVVQISQRAEILLDILTDYDLFYAPTLEVRQKYNVRKHLAFTVQ